MRKPLARNYTKKPGSRTELSKLSLHFPTALLRASLWLALAAPLPAVAFPADLFGYQQARQPDTGLFGQWIQVLERHLLLDVPEGNCSATRFNRCHLNDWLAFLDTLRERPRGEQLAAVNRYANQKRYILDIDNYGAEDYWAVAREFLYNDGDCEDYAITKLFSLRWLDFSPAELRIVVLQDTNLRVPHAVLAVADQDDILILDNQIQEVVSHQAIVHYLPVYSINEQHWWIHLPD
jgi:predicted transglutaminase-like cysteine proteinase